ncbi:MAG: flagellar export protein FliJ [Magnetococcales bacterium]|nr:flagellar export protein FliJ [Magnetococcales bacterium]
MNRFGRLVELRKIREEAAANALARVLGRIRKNQEEMAALDRETEAEKIEAKANLISGRAIPPIVYEDFFRGQAVRHQRLVERHSRLQVEAENARQVWHGARVMLQQAEKLAEKDAKVRAMEGRRKEGKELDMVGVLGASHPVS